MKEKISSYLFTSISAWLVTIGFDFFLHGGLLARIYTQESPFLLPAESAFARIPLGYASFLILVILLKWLSDLANIIDRKRGFVFGLKFGLIAWGAFTLGLYSISTASVSLLLGWWLGQALELGLAGFVIGACAEATSKKKIVICVAGFLVLMIVLTVVLQIVGVAPPMKTV